MGGMKGKQVHGLRALAKLLTGEGDNVIMTLHLLADDKVEITGGYSGEALVYLHRDGEFIPLHESNDLPEHRHFFSNVTVETNSEGVTCLTLAR